MSKRRVQFNYSFFVSQLQVTKSKVCINFSVVRRYKVARVRDAAVQVYDYYEPGRWSQETPLRSSPGARTFTLTFVTFFTFLHCSEGGDSDVQLGLSARGRLLLLLRPGLQPLPAGRGPHRDLLAVDSLLRKQRRHLRLGLPASRRRGFFNGVVIRKPRS